MREVRTKALAAQGDAEAARAELIKARRLYEEFGANGHVKRLTREIGS